MCPRLIGEIYTVYQQNHAFVKDTLSEEKQQRYRDWATAKRAEFAAHIEREIGRVHILQQIEEENVQRETDEKKQRQKMRRAELRELKRKREEELQVGDGSAI